jgi:hypothetical protein
MEDTSNHAKPMTSDECCTTASECLHFKALHANRRIRAAEVLACAE